MDSCDEETNFPDALFSSTKVDCFYFYHWRISIIIVFTPFKKHVPSDRDEYCIERYSTTYSVTK